MSHRRYKQPTKLRIYIARLQGAILCYVFLYVFCFDFIFISFTFILAITKDVNTKTLKIYCNKVKFNRSSPLLCTRKKSKVMCNASYICMCALSHMCMLIHIQKCPVTLIINPVPLLVCKEIDSYPSYSHNNMTRYT